MVDDDNGTSEVAGEQSSKACVFISGELAEVIDPLDARTYDLSRGNFRLTKTGMSYSSMTMCSASYTLQLYGPRRQGELAP
jgi:hypothetical protein